MQNYTYQSEQAEASSCSPMSTDLTLFSIIQADGGSRFMSMDGLKPRFGGSANHDPTGHAMAK